MNKLNGIKLIAFDLDGVLVDGRGSWAEVHKGLGTLKQSELNGKEYFSGRITFDEWAERDVTLWDGVDIERIKEILYRSHLMKGIDETLTRLKKDYRLAIISGGLKILADHLKERFGMDYSFGNEFRIDDGKVMGINQVVDFKGKGRILKEIADDAGIETGECAAVGDYINDIPMFKAAGFSIAFNPKDESILEYADEVIYEKDLSRLLTFF